LSSLFILFEFKLPEERSEIYEPLPQKHGR